MIVVVVVGLSVDVDEDGHNTERPMMIVVVVVGLSVDVDDDGHYPE